eukprot:4918560-Pyramimonas_sp.AAC.1
MARRRRSSRKRASSREISGAPRARSHGGPERAVRVESLGAEEDVARRGQFEQSMRGAQGTFAICQRDCTADF